MSQGKIFRQTCNQNQFGLRAYCAVVGCQGLVQIFGVCKSHYDFIRRANKLEELKQKAKQKYQRKKDQIKKRTKLWAQANAHLVKNYKTAWKKRNKGWVNASTMRRYASKKNATPPWADLKEIQKIYENRPPGFHVDHIVQLRGKEVCGLHVPWNLQYLPAAENMKKGNRLYEAN